LPDNCAAALSVVPDDADDVVEVEDVVEVVGVEVVGATVVMAVVS
jgi:hypothetical protein